MRKLKFISTKLLHRHADWKRSEQFQLLQQAREQVSNKWLLSQLTYILKYRKKFNFNNPKDLFMEKL